MSLLWTWAVMSDRDEMTDNVNDEMIPLTLPRTKTVKFREPWDATSKFEEALLCILSVQLSILPPAVSCVSYRGSSGAAGMPSSCICPRLSLCVLKRNGSNALSHSSLVSFYIRPSWRSVASFADTTEELSSALTQTQNQLICLLQPQCFLLSRKWQGRFVFVQSDANWTTAAATHGNIAHLGGAPIQDGGADFSRVGPDKYIISLQCRLLLYHVT